MKRSLFVSALILLIATAAFCQRRGPRRGGPPGDALPAAHAEHEKRILGVLETARTRGDVYANVPAADGRMLRLLTEAVGAKQVVEIGASTGLSGLWFSMALERTGGKLTTFELDPGRAATARKNFQQAGVDKIVTLVEGDAHKNITTLKGPIDVVFIDAEKEGYVDYLNKLLPLVRPGGLILAHNVGMIDDYIAAVNANPALETTYYMEGGGLAITMKKR